MHPRLFRCLGMSLVLVGCSTPAADEPDPGWTWSIERVRSAVGQVRAGRDLNPPSWPGGARVAVLLSFDADNETVWLRFADSNPGSLSQGEYGARRGLGRVLDVLDRHQVPATFFIPTVSLQLHPEMATAIHASGRHEFATHGWIHEMNTQLDSATEHTLLQRAVTEMEQLTGTRPVGYRAPSWNFSPHTLDIIRDLGFVYESSMMADDRPYELMQRGVATGLVELPVEWILDDAPLLNPLGNRYSAPRDLLQVYIDEFDVAWEERTMLLLTMHPHYIGHRSRIVILDALIEHAKARGDVWFGTHLQAVEWVKQHAGM